jgi:hypothetical protein
MISLIPEDGTARPDANTYASLPTAEVYFGTRPRWSPWPPLTEDEKAQHLIHATRILDACVAWHGERVSSAQALAWPRVLSDLDAAEIPPAIVTATCELALALIGQDLTADPAAAGFKSLEVGPLKIEPSPAALPTLPRFVRDLIAPYGVPRGASNNAKLLRT